MLQSIETWWKNFTLVERINAAQQAVYAEMSEVQVRRGDPEKLDEANRTLAELRGARVLRFLVLLAGASATCATIYPFAATALQSFARH